MKTFVSAAVGFAAAGLALVACGGGGGGMSATGSIERPQMPRAPATRPVVTHDGVAVGYGTRKDGVTGATLAGFLTHHRRTDSPYSEGQLWHPSTPPVVRVASGATPQYIQEVREAVEIINRVLPPDWQMTFDPTPRQEDQPFGHGTVWYPGEITVNYAPSEERGRLGGFARAGGAPDGSPPFNEEFQTYVTTSSRVSISTDHGGSSAHRRALVVHEIGHTLGIGGDSWAEIYKLYPNSVMTYSPTQHGLSINGRGVLYALDRDSFRALYSVLQPGMTVEETYDALGDWMDSTMHISGEFAVAGDSVTFGAFGKNGFMEAYARGGATPAMNLADNAALSGTAAWAGRLLGIDAESSTVAGAAGLSVDLVTLAGSLDFTGLESWAAGQTPGAIGTGALWGDGDLGYSISVRGNAFVQTGGDDGVVAGRFAGAAHEGMVGTLERNDLAAGFGGTRQP